MKWFCYNCGTGNEVGSNVCSKCLETKPAEAVMIPDDLFGCKFLARLLAIALIIWGGWWTLFWLFIVALVSGLPGSRSDGTSILFQLILIGISFFSTVGGVLLFCVKKRGWYMALIAVGLTFAYFVWSAFDLKDLKILQDWSWWLVFGTPCFIALLYLLLPPARKLFGIGVYAKMSAPPHPLPR